MASGRDKAKRHLRYRASEAARNRKMRIMYDIGWFVYDVDDPNYKSNRLYADRVCALEVPFVHYKKGAKQLLGSFKSVHYDPWYNGIKMDRKRERESKRLIRESVVDWQIRTVQCPLCGVDYAKEESLIPGSLSCPNCGCDYDKAVHEYMSEWDDIRADMYDDDFDYNWKLSDATAEDGMIFVDFETIPDSRGYNSEVSTAKSVEVHGHATIIATDPRSCDRSGCADSDGA